MRRCLAPLGIAPGRLRRPSDSFASLRGIGPKGSPDSGFRILDSYPGQLHVPHRSTPPMKMRM